MRSPPGPESSGFDLLSRSGRSHWKTRTSMGPACPGLWLHPAWWMWIDVAEEISTRAPHAGSDYPAANPPAYPTAYAAPFSPPPHGERFLRRPRARPRALGSCTREEIDAARAQGRFRGRAELRTSRSIRTMALQPDDGNRAGLRSPKDRCEIPPSAAFPRNVAQSWMVWSGSPTGKKPRGLRVRLEWLFLHLRVDRTYDRRS